MADERLDLEKSPTLEITAREITAKETSGLRPRYPGYGYGDGYGKEEGKIHLRELWRTVRKRKWLIVTIVFIITTLVAIEMYRTKNTYQATTMIEIGKDTSSVARTGGMVLDDYDPFYLVNIKTKMLSIQSRALLEDVVIEKKLDRNPKFLEIGEKKSIWEALKTIGAKFGGPSADTNESGDETTIVETTLDPDAERELREACIKMLQANMAVEPIRETKALRVSFSHTDPKLASEICNAIAQTFLDRNFADKTKKFTKSKDFLEQSKAEMKARLKRAEEDLAAYTREHGFFSTDGKETTLTTVQLGDLHNQLLRIEADRRVKQNIYEEVKKGNVNNLPVEFADLVYKTSSKLGALQRELEQFEMELAGLNEKYGPDHPKIIDTQKKMNKVRDQMSAGTRALEEKIRTDYERVVREEQMIRTRLGLARGEAVQQNQDAIQLNIFKQEVETAKALYTDFLQKSNQADVQVAEQANNVRVIEPAPEKAPMVGPRRMFTILAAFMLSLAAAVGLAFFLDYLDNTIKTVDDVSRYAQLPALSVIPAGALGMPRRLSAKGKKAINGRTKESIAQPSNQLAALDTRSSAAEAYRVLRTSVLLSAAGKPPKRILITSGQPGEGKTTTVINTAISLAQLGASVLVIDCDLRRPTTHKVLGVDHLQGLSTYLSRDIDIDEVIQKLQIANLSLLPCGPIPPNPAELIASDRMKALLDMLSERYDHILIDSPPLINVTDPVILSTMVDGVILVVHGGKSTRDVVRRARQELTSVGAKIFGVVLNNVDLKRDGYDNYYHYRYYSGYGQENTGSD
jgi:succinoglycan biosynthesis transport protein ExoP